MPLVNLNRKLDNSKKLYLPKGSRKKYWVKVFLAVLFLVLAIYLPLRGVYGSARGIQMEGRVLADAMKRENFDDIKSSVKKIDSHISGLNFSLNFLYWIRIIPFAGGYFADAKHFATAAGFELDVIQDILIKIEPSKIELGFTGSPSPGQDKVAQFVKIMEKVLPDIDKFEPNLKKARDSVESIDASKYPEQFRSLRVRSLIESGKNFIIGAHIAVTEHKDALMVAPEALGATSPKTYLLLFQNDKEIRGTGGFMTAYAYLKLDKGNIASSQSDDIYRMDEKLLEICKNKVCPHLKPPAPIVAYLPEADGRPRGTWSLRDSNLSPDLETSIKDFEEIYKNLGDGTPWDGIIMIDTHVVEELIKITGPIEVFGTQYSAEKDDRCNCPNVIYELENYAQIIEKGEKDRKAVLGTLMQQILARSLGSATDKMPLFINAGVTLANGKHIMFYMHDQKTQDALGKLNWTGKIKDFAGDYLHINDSNFAGGKSNLYVEQEVNIEINTKDKKNKLTINYKNPQKYSTWLNGINRDYVRVYVPKGSKLTSSKGSDVKVTTIEEELGKTVFEAFIQVRPQNSRILSFEYDLPQSYKGDNYPLMIQKQPGAKWHKYTVKVDGKKKAEFNLDMDKIFEL